ncbi:MAG: DNA polymerase-4 [Polyangiales bacterium]|jgi:DNA polymerase-4
MSEEPRERAILHVDMDAFYASVEQRDNPSLKGKPVIVGGDSRRGVVCAASYEARRFGVHSAMSMVEAMRRCPQAAITMPRMSRYSEVSEQVFDVFRRYTPQVEGLSIDEAFLDVTGSRTLFGSSVEIAKSIKEEILAETQLYASAGVANSKFVAKVASDLDKPDGLVVVAAEGVAEFLAPLAIERMWGVGPKAAVRLRDLGFSTFHDLASTPPDVLESLLGSWGKHIHRLAQGIDEREVFGGGDAKSIGGEVTFDADLCERDAIEEHLLAQSVRVAGRLHSAGLWARVITVKIKYANHRSKTRQLRVDPPLASTDAVFAVACGLLERFSGLERGVRLCGVSTSDFVSDPPLELFADAKRERSDRLEALTGELRTRFGKQGATRARLLPSKARVRKKTGRD